VTYETPRKTLLGEDSLAHYADREFSKETARQIEGARLLLEKETLSRKELPPLAEIRLAAA